MDEYRSSYRVLLADPDADVHQTMCEYFKREGYQVIDVYDGVAALENMRRVRPDIVVMGVMLPKMDGLTLLRELRKESLIPVIILSEKKEEFDRLLGLEMGADDYITKPFSPREVIARIKVIMRRLYEMKMPDRDTHIACGNLDVDMGAFIVKLDGVVVPCTPKEIEILWTLAENPGMVFSREHLLQSIWGYDYLGDTRAVDSHIKRIRAKLCKPGNIWDIKTVWGVGYRFEIEE